MASNMVCVRMILMTVLVVILVANVYRVEGDTIVVGGSAGWTNTGFNYVTWEKNQTFRVGDVVVFMNKDAIEHTVELLQSQADFDACNVGSGVGAIPISPGTNRSITIPATTVNQVFYAACTIPGHCLQGQKVSGTVLPALTAPTGAPTTPTATPPAPNKNDADMNKFFCWTTAVVLIAACFFGPSFSS